MHIPPPPESLQRKVESAVRSLFKVKSTFKYSIAGEFDVVTGAVASSAHKAIIKISKRINNLDSDSEPLGKLESVKFEIL